MPEDNNILQIIVTLPWVIFLSIMGGMVAFIRRLNQSTTPQPLLHIFLRLAGELAISGFAGLVTFLLCSEWGVSANMTAVAVAISGHMGGNAIDKIVQTFSQKIDQKTKL